MLVFGCTKTALVGSTVLFNRGNRENCNRPGTLVMTLAGLGSRPQGPGITYVATEDITVGTEAALSIFVRQPLSAWMLSLFLLAVLEFPTAWVCLDVSMGLVDRLF